MNFITLSCCILGLFSKVIIHKVQRFALFLHGWMKTDYKSIPCSYLELRGRRGLEMIGEVWEKGRFLMRVSEKDCLACAGKGTREIVSRNTNEGPGRRKLVGDSSLLKNNKYEEQYIQFGLKQSL